jgi:hypothetical protein
MGKQTGSRSPGALLVGMYRVQSSGKTVGELLKRLNTELQVTDSSTQVGVYSRIKNVHPHKTLHMNVHSSIIQIAQSGNNLKVHE